MTLDNENMFVGHSGSLEVGNAIFCWEPRRPDIFDFRAWSCFEPLACNVTGAIWAVTLFPSPFIYADFIFELSLLISLLPTERKNFPWAQKWKPGIQVYLKIPVSYAFSDARFGIYAKSCVYSKVFGIIALFWRKVSTRSCFWAKSCFCCSRTAKTVPVTFDPGSENFRVESTYG